MRHLPLSLLTLSIYASFTHAQPTQDEPTVVLDEMKVTLSKDAGKYVATKPNSLKDSTPLYQTAQSISVLTPQQVEQKQASSVAELLENVAGVSSGVQGRRGWDDFIIRGQVSSNQVYVDGMRVQMSDNNLRAWDISAADSVEVVKGVATAQYGMALPGGMVNITSKRPDDESFIKGKVTVGSYNQKELSYDINHAPNASNKGAFRVSGRIADRDDATDHVYFKSYQVSPSYTFDLSDKTDLTLLGNYQWRNYLRQQGLPHNNTIDSTTGVKTIRNAHEKYSPSTFFGLPNNDYEQTTLRLGYDLAHQINDDTAFKSIFAATRTKLDGNPVLSGGANNFWKNGTITRQINNQIKQDTMYTMDNRIEHFVNTGNTQHNITVGVDLLREKSDYYRRNDIATPAFDINNPSYTVDGVRMGSPNHEITTTQYAGLYLKDTISYGNFSFGLTGRHDWASTNVHNVLTDKTTTNADNAFTGNASVMYNINDKIAPYISYGTSFQQNTALGKHGEALNPETGSNAEIGIKFQGFDRHLQGYLSYYDLTRNNVAETVYDDNGVSLGYADLIGKQQTKGAEIEAALVLNNQWNISGSYSYIPTAKIAESSTTANIGKRISQIPKHAASLSTQYYFSPDRLGWYVAGGVRYQGERTAWRANSFIDLPAYTLFDLKAGYEADKWGFDVAVKNVADKQYLVGTTPNSQLVSYGEPRNIRAALTFKY